MSLVLWQIIILAPAGQARQSTATGSELQPQLLLAIFDNPLLLQVRCHKSLPVYYACRCSRVSVCSLLLQDSVKARAGIRLIKPLIQHLRRK